MLMLGPLGVPVIGEAWAVPFNLQIQIDELNWKLTPETHQETAPQEEPEAGIEDDDGESGDRPRLQRPENAPPFEGDELLRSVLRMQRNARYTQAQRDLRVRELIKRAVREHDRERAQADARNGQAAGEEDGGSSSSSSSGDGDEHDLTFEFGKNADAATSQMLTLMTNQTVFPTVLVTVFHRSLHAPMTLLITYEDVRLTNYTLDCNAEEMMSDVTEKWTASYKKMSFVYQNRPPLGLPYSIASGVAAAATQGRIKEFTMEDRE